MSDLIRQLRKAVLLGKHAALSDGQLLDGFVTRREEEALEVLVRRHAHMVWSVCRRVLSDYHDAEDAFQATFLVFVRKAASIHTRATVGNWLHGVALKTALRVRETQAKRDMREKQMEDTPEPLISEQNLQSVLDQELSQLPEKYRTVIVLCDLEGKTIREAARQLSLPQGTVASRIARAKTMLAKRLRLNRANSVVPTGALATLLAQGYALAAPRILLKSTIKAAALLAAGHDAAGVALPSALALAEKVIQGMIEIKYKMLAIALFVPLLIAGLIFGLAQTSGQSVKQPLLGAAKPLAPQLKPLPPKKDPPKHITNSIGMKFVWIPPGSFRMGSPPGEEGRKDSETAHPVTLTKGFYVSVHTVTQEQWEAIMGNNPSRFKGDKNLPVDQITWDDSQLFIKRLREKDQRAYRLPTEAEWEYCCRAGTTTPFHFGKMVELNQANYENGMGRKKTTPIGSFPANAWGLHDMHGNVWQFCQDWLGDHSDKEATDPQGPATGTHRVMRGGSWYNGAEWARSAARHGIEPNYLSFDCGFRLCFFADFGGEPATVLQDELKYFTNSKGIKFVWIPPGHFMMGSPKDEPERKNNETQHKVTLTKGFFMGVYPVTQWQWKEIMGNNPSKFDDNDDLPVDQITWEDAQEFLKKLREKDKKAYRLPTEAEWEYCCRAGTTTPFHFGKTINLNQANYENGVGRKKTTPVDSFPANAWGLYDMHGNVWQFCQDWLGDHSDKEATNPQGPPAGNHRVMRGGSWFTGPEWVRSAARHAIEPNYLSFDCGFRICFYPE